MEKGRRHGASKSERKKEEPIWCWDLIPGTGRVGIREVWARRRCRVAGWGRTGFEAPLEISWETEGRRL